MNFSQGFDWFISGMEWRGLRTKDHCHTRWLNGKVELFDLRSDPLQMNNLADSAAHAELRARLEARMATLKARRGDSLVACTDWKNWLDSQRRVVRNAYGELGDPEKICRTGRCCTEAVQESAGAASPAVKTRQFVLP